MTSSYERVKIKSLDAGLITDISRQLLNETDGYALELLNQDLSVIGIPKKRPAKVSALDALAGAVKGCFAYTNQQTNAHYIVAIHDDSIMVWNSDSTTWDAQSIYGYLGGVLGTQTLNHSVSPILFSSTGLETDFEVIANKLAIANYITPILLWDGNSTTIIPEDAPVAKYLAVFQLRLVAAGIRDEPSLLYMSHTGDPTLWDFGASSNAVALYVSPDDGEPISGLLEIGEGGLLVGKPSFLYEINGYSQDTFVTTPIDASVGVGSHKSMVYVRPYAYFVNNQGIYRYSTGGIPKRISLPIQDAFDSLVDKTKIDEARAFMYKRNYVISLPKVGTAGGSVVFVYHTEREQWVEWDNTEIGESMYIQESNAPVIYFSEPDGLSFYKLAEGTLTDAGSTPIQAVTVIELGSNLPEVTKDFGDLYVILQRHAASYKVTVSVNPDNTGWVAKVTDSVIDAGEREQAVLRVTIGVTARFLKVRIVNNSAGENYSPLAILYLYQPKDVL